MLADTVGADADGSTGVGESAPLPQAGTEDLRESRRALTAFIEEGVPPHAGTTPAAAAAVELALLDLAARKAGLPLHRHLGRPVANHVTVNALLSAETPSDLAAQAEAHVREGFAGRENPCPAAGFPAAGSPPKGRRRLPLAPALLSRWGDSGGSGSSSLRSFTRCSVKARSAG